MSVCGRARSAADVLWTAAGLKQSKQGALLRLRTRDGSAMVLECTSEEECSILVDTIDTLVQQRSEANPAADSSQLPRPQRRLTRASRPAKTALPRKQAGADTAVCAQCWTWPTACWERWRRTCLLRT